jgi:lipopolysaccharide export system protein LptA
MIIRILSFLAVTILCTDMIQAQTRIQILEPTGRIVGATIDGEPVRKFLDQVRIATDRMVMDADSAWQFEQRNLFQAFNVQIETENEIIWADTLFYNTILDISSLRGRVIIKSEQNILFSEEMEVDMNEEIAWFNVPVRFEDDQGTLLAESGIYYQRLDSAVFRGNVQLADSTQYLEADSLFMNRESDYYRLFGNVYADDYEDRVTFNGDYLEADSLGYRLLEGNAWMMRRNVSESDTTHLLSDKIIVTETDSVNTIDTYGNVRLWSPRFSAIADTALYDNNTEIFRLISNPIAWQKNIQLKGPFIEAHFVEDEINKLVSYINPIAVQEDTLTKRLNQMTGDTLIARFEDGEIIRLDVFDDTEIIFHQKDDDGEPDGLLEMISAGRATLTFFEGDPDEFLALNQIEGSFLPEEPENIDRKLDNFAWNPELRPQRPEIRMPRLPAIPEERPFALPPRYITYLDTN